MRPLKRADKELFMKKWKGKKKIIIPVTAVILVGLLLLVPVVSGASAGKYRELKPEERDLSTYLEFSGNIETVTDSSVFGQSAGGEGGKRR